MRFEELRQQAVTDTPPRHHTSLFWVHGESEERLREEIARMDEAGMAGFVLESRTHPDFLGPQWWRDLNCILSEAAARRMTVWILDDQHYPSGYAAGIVARERPDLTKRYLAERHLDVEGPLPHARFIVTDWLNEGEELLAVVVAPRHTATCLDGAALHDVTENVRGNVFRWDVPAGSWRLFFIVATTQGGEEYTREYIDPLNPEAVDAYIEAVHAAIYRHLQPFVGSTFEGFFTDEPRFGNAASYTSLPGQPGQVLPYTADLFAAFEAHAGYALRSWLPALWYDCGERTGTVRHDYMDIVSNRFAQTFLGRIQAWCHAHDLKYIGHIVEDNGAHARLGYGPGHFFRAMRYLDMAGIDVVGYQVRPDYASFRTMNSLWGELDTRFFHWGLAKLASSAAHHQPDTHKQALCEAFGAYGWGEGLRLMKWLTDWQLVRGITFIVPHAFSAAPFPDLDCPPHFWAGGHNPQWPFFRYWADYANRLCALLQEGTHVAEAVVLYPAESQWAGGEADPCEWTIEALAKAHLDCDVLSYEEFTESEKTHVFDGALQCGEETYQAVILPSVERITSSVLARLVECHEQGVQVVCLGGVPQQSCREQDAAQTQQLARDLTNRLRERDGGVTGGWTYETLGSNLRHLGLGDITPQDAVPHLRRLHKRYGDVDVYFLVNESTHTSVDTAITFRATGTPELWDPLTRMAYSTTPMSSNDVQTQVRIRLKPYESIIVAFNPTPDRPADDSELAVQWLPPQASLTPLYTLQGPWEVSRTLSADAARWVNEPRVTGLGDWTEEEKLPGFAGTLRYRTTVLVENQWADDTMTLDLGSVYELARVRLDGEEVGVRICPPYHFPLGRVGAGAHTLEIEVTNTLGAAIHGPLPHDQAIQHTVSLAGTPAISSLDIFSRYAPAEPAGLLGPVSLYREGWP